ncbi:MAG: VWA domain-containing protein [Chloroflexi bacterium]|nr:VWA domain-containing protein [Chloroflexota bacterium]
MTGTVDARYTYEDMAQPGGTYNSVMLSGNRAITTSGGFLALGESVNPWGARYYQFTPAADVPVLPITVTQDSLGAAFYVVLGIRNGEIVREIRRESRNLELTLINENFDKVMVMVAGLDSIVNYRIAVNGAQPTMRIVRPTTANKVQVGDPAAPDKFLATIDVVDAAGVPLPGLAPDQFHFRIGARDVSAADIVGSAIVQGQAWFVMRAVTQTAVGDYDLTVDYQHALTVTESGAVQYQPRTAVDNVLVIDRSGSMAYADKLTSTKQAAKLYVDSWKPGDRIAVESFNNIVEMPMQMKGWTTDPLPAPIGSREEALNAIDALTDRGATAIGDAIMAGWDELKARGDAAHGWSLVLLSDGLHNAGTKSFDDAVAAVARSTDKKPAIYTLAVGPDADRLRMQRAADATGGTYHYVSAPADGTAARGAATMTDTLLLPLHLDEKYRFIATQADDMQQFFGLNGPIVTNSAVEQIYIPVDAKAGELVLSLSWLPQMYSYQLYDPYSNTVAPTLEVSGRQAVWRVTNPASGFWRLQVYGSNRSNFRSVLPPYYVQGALRSTLALHAFVTTPPDERAPGAPVHLVAFLNDSGPVTGAMVTATVRRPDPDANDVSVVFYDDGAHGDGEADDGVYGNDFVDTALSGSYQVKHYYRCLRIGRDDSNGDPDKDGLPNAREYALGTNPCDSDSDDDGESDGSDPRPLERDEGRTQPPWTVAWPGRGKTWVKYTVTDLSRAQIYRRVLSATVEARLRPAVFAADDADPYVLIDTQEPATGVFTDTADVVNGFSYCYLVVGETADGQRTVAQDETCTTPRVDPSPPHGGILIAGGAAEVRGAQVALTLLASDSVSPHTSEDFGGELMTPPADAESGVTEMRIANDSAFTGAVWEPYESSRMWLLDETQSLPTVYVQYRDGAGNESEVYVAAIHMMPEYEMYMPFVQR